MARNTNALFKALGKTASEQPTARPAQVSTQSREYYVPPSREGKYHISTWVPKEMKTSLRLIQVKDPNRGFQDLCIEALNDLFAKYNVPTVGSERPAASVKKRRTPSRDPS